MAVSNLLESKVGRATIQTGVLLTLMGTTASCNWQTPRCGCFLKKSQRVIHPVDGKQMLYCTCYRIFSYPPPTLQRAMESLLKLFWFLLWNCREVTCILQMGVSDRLPKPVRRRMWNEVVAIVQNIKALAITLVLLHKPSKWLRWDQKKKHSYRRKKHLETDNSSLSPIFLLEMQAENSNGSHSKPFPGFLAEIDIFDLWVLVWCMVPGPEEGL